MGIFYRQHGITYPEHPPVMPIPSSIAGPIEKINELQDQTTDSKSRQSSSQEQIFKSLCRFCRILHEVTSVYYENQATFVPNSISLQFAEFKYRELLAWADELPPVLLRSDDNPHIVLIIQYVPFPASCHGIWLNNVAYTCTRPFSTSFAHSFEMRSLSNLTSTSGHLQRLKLLLMMHTKHPCTN